VPRFHLPVVTRRDLLAWIGATGASSSLTVACSSAAKSTVPPASTSPPPAPYLTAEQRSVLGALADAVIPPDDAPGGSALGVVDYIENLLTALELPTPLIFSGGPYSNRQPLPNADGTPSSSFPPDDLSTFLPLDRFATRAWQLRILGSAGVPGGGPNDAVTGPVVGLRDAVKKAVQQALSAAPANVSLDALSSGQQTAMLMALDATTRATIIQLVLEGAFTAPEYGGNKNRAGWTMTYFEGDSVPYGYSTYDTTTGKYVDHADAPCATANPGPDPMPMDSGTSLLVGSACLTLGGKVFG